MANSPVPTVTHQQGVTVVSLGPGFESLDGQHLGAVSESILDAAKEANPPCLLVDLSHTNFFGSSFIEVLFRMANRITHRENGRFGIAGLTPYCAEVISITHLDELWATFDSVEDGVAALGGS